MTSIWPAQRLRDAALIIMDRPAGLELGRTHMITEVRAEQNSMTVVLMPSQFVPMVRTFAEKMNPKKD